MEEDRDAEGEDGGGNTADNHAKHDEEGIDGRYATQEDAAQEQRHREETQHGEVGDGRRNDGHQGATQERYQGLQMGQAVASQELILFYVGLQGRDIGVQAADHHHRRMT